jgi:hypothetical protein
MSFIIVICNVIYLNFSAPTIQNKAIHLDFLLLSAKKYNMSNASRR